jgi:hypothetical protein
MGNWHISIEGVGIHHNSPNEERDANNMAREFTRKLAKAGHFLTKSTFTHGGSEDFLIEIGRPEESAPKSKG